MGMVSAKEVPVEMISWGWAVPPGDDLFVSHAAELCSGWPLDPRREHRTDFWQLDYSFTPHRLKIGADRWRTRETGVAYLIPRYVPWQGRSVPEYPATPHKCTLTFAVSDRLEFDRKYRQDTPLGYTRFRDPDRILANTMVHIAAVARAGGDQGYNVVHALAWDLLQSLMALQPREPGLYEIRAADLRVPVDPVVSRATAFLQTHLAEKIGAQDVARHMSLSPSTLAHHFKAAGESSLMKVLQRLRILRAKALLAKGWKLDAIAEATGFYGGFHLSRIFKRHTGFSPAAYLQRQRSSPVASSASTHGR